MMTPHSKTDALPAPHTGVIQLDPALRLVLEKIRVAAEQQESGNSITPLSDQTNRLLQTSLTADVKIIVLGLCAKSHQAVIELLRGPDAPRIPDSLTRGDEVIELPSQSNEACLLIPPNLASLLRYPEILTRLSRSGDVLLLAGMDNEPSTAGLAEVLAVLGSGIPVSQALIVCKSGQSQERHPAWLELLRTTAAVAPARVILSDDDSAQLAPGSSLVSGKTALLHPLIGNYRIAREAATLAMVLRQQNRAESDGLTERRRMAEVTANNPSDPGFRSAVEQFNASMQSDTAALIRHIDDEARDSLLPGGILSRLIKQIAEGFNHHVLTTSLQLKTTRYEASGELCQRLRDQLLDQLVADISRQKNVIEESTAASAEVLANRLCELTGTTVGLSASQLDAARLFNFATTMAGSPLSLKFEIPRTSGVQFAWNCFQNPVMLLMSVMMPMSLFLASPEVGPMLRKIRFDVALYGLVPIYIVTPFFLRHKLRKETDVNIEKEIERLRSSLQMDLERVARTVSDERRKTATDWIKSMTEDLRKQAMSFLGDFSKHDEKRRLDDKQSQASTLQRLDARLRELNQASQQCDQLERDARQSLSTLVSSLGAALR